jgi:hypothetical protein
MSSNSTAKTVAETAILKCMESEVGRKIIVSKILALNDENRRLKNKYNEARISVFSLNEISKILTKIIENNYSVYANAGIPMDPKSKSLNIQLTNFMQENFGETMMLRVEGILNDTDGDDLLLRDLIGKEGAANG